jgi:hypothetical protein
MLFNFINFDSIVVVSAILVFSIFIYTLYLFFYVLRSSNNFMVVFDKFKLGLIRLSSFSSTVVGVSTEELNSLLEVVFREIGSSNYISVQLLFSLGLYTPTVIRYLESLGYIIYSAIT